VVPGPRRPGPSSGARAHRRILSSSHGLDASAAAFETLPEQADPGRVFGLYFVRDETGLNLQAKSALRNAVKDENADRSKLYAEVAKALNIEASQIEKIEKIFAVEWAKSAAAGWWVQNEDGTWVKK